MQNKNELLVPYMGHYSSVTGTATPQSGFDKINFLCTQKVNFVSNDDGSNDLIFSLDAPVGSGRDIILRAGEVIDDMAVSCRELYVQSAAGSVTFRAVGY